MNHVTAAGGRAEAERWLGIAEKLLGARDLVGSKKFADRAMELDPLLDGVDQIVAVADVLLAAQRRVNNQVDWYSILQIDPPSADPSAVKRSYRRLALLLHPDRNKISGADIAFRLVSDAWGVLSDPYKRSLFDAELNIAAGTGAAVTNGAAPSGDPEAFWTACSSCCHVHQFAAAYRNLKLRCPTCEQPFTASQIAAPPIVPGSDMYYCSWGFFPLGFPGGPTLSTSATGSPDAWKPFHPMAPQPSGPKTNPCVGDAVNRVGGDAVNRVDGTAKENNAVEPKPQRTTPVRNRKKMARKKVGSVGSKKFPAGRGTAAKGININEEAKVMDFEEEIGGSANADMSNIHIDLDSTDEILGNLHNIPFLKDDEAHMRIP